MKHLGKKTIKQKGGQDDDCDYKLMRTLRYGHVTSVAVFPDGKKIVAGGGGKMKVWDAESGQERCTLSGHCSSMNAVAVCPNNTCVVSGSDRTVKIWDAESGDELRTLSGSRKEVKVWDATTGKDLQTLNANQRSQSGRGVAIFPDGGRFVSGGGKEVKVWEEDKMVLTRKANDVVDKIRLNDDIIRMIKDKLPTYCSELNRLSEIHLTNHIINDFFNTKRKNK